MKKNKQHIIIILIMLVFSFSSMGIPFISACCEDDNIVELLTESSTCCFEEVQNEENSCCSEIIEKTDQTCKNNCDGPCFVKYSYSKLEIDQILITQKLIKTVFVLNQNLNYNIEQNQPLDYSKTQSNKSPPIIGGRTLVIELNKSKIPFPLVT